MLSVFYFLFSLIFLFQKTSLAQFPSLIAENKMAAADCAKSQDSSTDTMPVEMQGLKEVLEKASKKPLMKEDTWWVYLVLQVWKPPNVLLLEQSMTGVILTRVQNFYVYLNAANFTGSRWKRNAIVDDFHTKTFQKSEENDLEPKKLFPFVLM